MALRQELTDEHVFISLIDRIKLLTANQTDDLLSLQAQLIEAKQNLIDAHLKINQLQADLDAANAGRTRELDEVRRVGGLILYVS